MNRLQLRHELNEETSVQQPRSSTPPSQLTIRSLTARTALFAPIHYEANYAYPLVVWLHGAGSTERQLRDIMPRISLRNYIGVAVRGTPASISPSVISGLCPSLGEASHVAPNSGADPAIGGMASWQQSPEGIEVAHDLVLQAVELAQVKFNINPQRIFLLGAGAGGTMALRLALRMPRLFAGVASLGGAFPAGHLPLAALTAARQRIRVLMTHCRADDAYPTAQLCDNLRLFHAAGIDVTVRQYPQAEYLQREQLADVDTWVMSQIQSQTATSDNVASRYDGMSSN